MKSLRKILLTVVAAICLMLPATAGRAADEPPTATLTIRIADLRNHKGDLIFGLFKQADGFPSTKDKSVNWQVKPAADGVEFTAKLAPGKYAASVLHDENRNGKMDNNAAGIPVEGYGVTNNPKPKFRGATFKEATFDLPPQGATLTISVQYFR
ncbi:MAG TPA: DUF2141 domain-containing protein [Humisphaera sp.]|jgi:uncharacterized protein (DUF2141 family)|nr:DUF2141 domain-containing protein [Humisphaera sp.]